MTPLPASVSLKMVRRELDNIPEYSFPSGFSLRAHQPGDAEQWTQIHLQADRLNQITPQLFVQQFGSDDTLLAGRQFYVVDSSRTPVGTGTAWFNDSFEGGRWGRIHWVAIRPDYQGLGLAKPLMTALCRR